MLFFSLVSIYWCRIIARQGKQWLWLLVFDKTSWNSSKIFWKHFSTLKSVKRNVPRQCSMDQCYCCRWLELYSRVWDVQFCFLCLVSQVMFPNCVSQVYPLCANSLLHIYCLRLTLFFSPPLWKWCLSVCLFLPCLVFVFSFFFFSNIKTVIFTSLISSHLTFLSRLQFVQNIAPHRHPKKRSYYSCFNFSPVVAS